MSSPVRLGSILFTLVEPHRGHEVAYNRWYERDHFYAGCLVGPGILAGARFVATRDLKALRAGSEIAPSPDAGSYLAMYWIERSMQDEWGTWAAKEVHRLHREGRMFAERDHVHTKMYRYRGGLFRDADGVPPELALDRRYPGLAVAFFDAASSDERDAAIDVLKGREDLVHGSAAAMCLFFTAVPIPSDAPDDVPRITGDERRFLTLWFLEDHPAPVWAERFGSLADDVKDTARLVWASPFIPTIPGTDTYTDQLW